jgi:ArsR family metal-binding transcriptional regulator
MPNKPVLSWRYEGHNIGFWPDRIAVDNLESREHVEQMVERLVDLVNQTWEKRDQLEPDFTTHQRLQPLELYQLLPRTNCKLCGQDTCFNFALQLVAAQAGLESCTPLYDEPTYQDQRARLESLLATKWPAL